LLPPFLARAAQKKEPGPNREGISATRLSRGDPWAFRPILADGLALSSTMGMGAGCVSSQTPYRASVRNFVVPGKPPYG